MGGGGEEPVLSYSVCDSRRRLGIIACLGALLALAASNTIGGSQTAQPAPHVIGSTLVVSLRGPRGLYGALEGSQVALYAQGLDETEPTRVLSGANRSGRARISEAVRVRVAPGGQRVAYQFRTVVDDAPIRIIDSHGGL